MAARKKFYGRINPKSNSR